MPAVSLGPGDGAASKSGLLLSLVDGGPTLIHAFILSFDE